MTDEETWPPALTRSAQILRRLDALEADVLDVRARSVEWADQIVKLAESAAGDHTLRALVSVVDELAARVRQLEKARRP